MSDKHFASVQLLCGFNGADAATAFTDESTAARVATFVGNAQLDTAQAKWGSASLLVDGTGDWVTFPDAAAFTLGTSDFTLECWVRAAALGASLRGIFGQWEAGGNQRGSGIFYNGTSNQIEFFYSTTGANSASFTGAYTLALNTWAHFAVTRSGADLRLFADGVQCGTTGNIGASSIFNSTATMKVGLVSAAGTPWNGWIDDARFTVGVARYVANFRPPRGPFDRRKNLGVLGGYRQPIVAATSL